MNAGRALPRRQLGLSLVELLVAITIGAILLSGAVSLFVSNKVTYQVTNDLSRLQENARFALEMMVRDIRMAGYFGCVNDMTKVTNNTGLTDGSLWDIGTKPNGIAMEGVNDAVDTGAWSPSGRDIDASGTGDTGNIAPGTDAITVRYALGTGEDVTDGSPTLIDVDDVSSFEQDNIAIVSDCGAADLFIVSSVDGTNTLLTPNGLSRAYEANTNPTVAEFYAARYYVGNNGLTDADGTPHKSLYRERNSYDPSASGSARRVAERRELIDGVEQMQLLYGLDTNADGAPDVYSEAGVAPLNTIDAWRTVVTVRIALLLRTVDQYGTVQDQKVYRLLGPSGAAFGPYNDNRQRRVFITTAVVRNLQ